MKPNPDQINSNANNIAQLNGQPNVIPPNVVK